MPAKNGSAPAQSLRIVMIGLSIRSDWQNPAAHIHRSVVLALLERGQDVVFLEERRNDVVVGKFRAQGSAAVLAFDDEFPDIRYRSYDPPIPRELGVWLGLEASTADLMIVLRDAPAPLLEIYERLHAPHVVKLTEREVAGGTFLVDDSGRAIVAYQPLPAGGAAEVAELIERAWVSAGIVM